MPRNSLIPLVIVSGPTASGKTSLGVKLAKCFNGEIISADSMQIYKGIPIASAQPTETEKEGVPHRLMGFLDLGTPFSVYDYCVSAHKAIADITACKKLPIVVGGTGLYINTLADDIVLSPVGNTEIRENLLKIYREQGIDPIYTQLQKTDPITAASIEKNNVRRVIRAMEVYLTTGKTFHEYNVESRKNKSRYNTVWFNIEYENREILYERINRRVDKMIENGLVEEAKFCREMCNETGAAQAIGHKELYPYLDGKITLEQAAENLKTATRRYAKRQITWFKKREDTVSLTADKEDIFEKAKSILEKSEI